MSHFSSYQHNNLKFQFIEVALFFRKLPQSDLNMIIHSQAAIKICPASAVILFIILGEGKSGDHGLKRFSGIQISNKYNVNSSLIHKDTIWWGTSMTERKLNTAQA